MIECLVKRGILFGVLAGLLSVGSVMCQKKPAARKFPAGSSMKKKGKKRPDIAKTSIAEVEKFAKNMRDVEARDAVTKIVRALRAIDYKAEHAGKKIMKKRRKKGAKGAVKKGPRKSPGEKQAIKAAK